MAQSVEAVAVPLRPVLLTWPDNKSLVRREEISAVVTPSVIAKYKKDNLEHCFEDLHFAGFVREPLLAISLHYSCCSRRLSERNDCSR